MIRKLPLLACLLLLACGGPNPVEAPHYASQLGQPSALFTEALSVETRDPVDPAPYLSALRSATLQPADPHSLAAVLASLDALVWRQVDGLAPGVSHAVVHRSTAGLLAVAAGLRALWAEADGSRAPLQRAAIALALHDLALRVGAPKAAAKWRHRSGCVSEAALAGPIAWPPLGALDAASPIGPADPMPVALSGVAPFATAVPVEKVYADGCILNVNETSPLRGLRVVVVDLDNPRAQTIHVGLQASSATVLELGGKKLLSRSYAAAHGVTASFARAHVEAGRVRLLARVAQNQDGHELALVVLDDRGEPLRVMAPRPGEKATARASKLREIPLVEQPVSGDHLPVSVAALLAAGQTRRASAVFRDPRAPVGVDVPAHVDLLRIRALSAARDLPRNQTLLQLSAVVDRVLEHCPDCWEARATASGIAKQRKGFGTGTYASFDKLGISAASRRWTRELDPLLLAHVAVAAHGAGLRDFSRLAYDAVARRAQGSMLVADLDRALHRRVGAEEVSAACNGGTSRAGARCLRAHIKRGDLKTVLAELKRLRALRGNPSLHRATEISQLIAHGRVDDALRIYDALTPGRRSVTLLGVLLGGEQQAAAKSRFERDMLRAADAPYGYAPLNRLLGVTRDRVPTFEKQGAALVARDREKAYLPGAATAVLKRVESYRLTDAGLLHYWAYDLRRVSGSTDVAQGTYSGSPMVEGRRADAVLRRRIYKKDGRVIDPDPSSRGAQSATDLSQLQKGDYVEAITEGFALPDGNGQMVVDTPDVLPLRTSVREGVITLRRPAGLELKLWSHALLGKARERREGRDTVTEWRLTGQAPRRIEEGVPVLEARVGVSFGTNDYQRIASALDDRYRALDEQDPYMSKWVAEAVTPKETDKRKQLAQVVAAVGKVVVRSDAFALSDDAASFAGGPQRETAKWIIERGTGSRSWVVHRAMRELGLESSIAVAEARPFSAAPGFPPHTGRFTHPLVRVALGDEVIWIDADVQGPPLPPGRVSPELRNRKALLSNGQMVTVDAEAGADVDEIDIRLRLDEKGDAAGTITAIIHGRPAQGLARAFERVVGSNREKLLRNVVLGWLPWADVRSVKLSSDVGSWQVALRADVKLVGFARPEGRSGTSWLLPGINAVHRVFPRARSTTLGARYAAQADRKAALSIDEPLLYHVRRRIELPAGTKISHMAASLSVKAPALEAQRALSQTGAVITEDYRLNLPVGTVGAAAFDAFVQQVRRVDDGFMYGIRIERPRR